MQTKLIRGQDGTVQNSRRQLSSISSVPWWSTTTTLSQPTYGERPGQVRSLPVEHQDSSPPSVTKNGTDPGTDKGNTTEFIALTVPGDGQKQQVETANPTQSNPLKQPHFEVGFGQPAHPYVDHFYGVLSTCGRQAAGRLMLPMDDAPIYVNAKQYHGILRRRQCRAKLELENKVLRVRKPYMHESRHLHALRRPRGCGGRFLNTKKLNLGTSESATEKTSNSQLILAAGSQNSEVMQSERVNLSLFKETKVNGSTPAGSEVSSMYSGRDASYYSFNSLRPSARSLSEMLSGGQVIMMPSKWIGAADHCTNLNV